MSIPKNNTPPCYAWGGNEVPRLFTPCDLDAPYSMCCRSGIEEDNAPDACLPNGLCSWFAQNLDQVSTQSFWLESCSDPSWQDPSCAPLAKYVDPESDSGCWRDDVGNVPLGYCTDTNTYCCNRNVNNQTCCDTSVKSNVVVSMPVASVVLVTTSYSGSNQYTTTFVPTMQSTSSSTARGTSSRSSTVGPTTTVYNTKSSGGLSAGAGVGIGIAAAAGACAIGIGLFWLLTRRRRRRELQDPAIPNSGAEKRGPTELQANHRPSEIDSHRTHELD